MNSVRNLGMEGRGEGEHDDAMEKEVVQLLTVAAIVVGFFFVVRWLVNRRKGW